MHSLLLAAATVLAIVPYQPATVGGWTTYLKPTLYSDLLVTGDTVWCATREAGLLRYSLSQRRFAAITRSPSGLSGNELSALTYDRSGRLWIGTFGAGASRLSADGSSWLTVNPFDGLPSDSVNCLEAEGDTLWIGTPRGIAFWNGSQIAGSLPIFGQPSPFGSDNITGVVVRGDSLWVSTSAGIYVSRRSTGLTSWAAVNNGLLTTNVSALVTNDTLLFCLEGGRSYRYLNGQWQGLFGVGNVVRLRDDQGQVLAMTDQGFFRYVNGASVRLNTDPLGVVFNNESSWYEPAVIPGGRYAAARFTGVLVQPAPGVPGGWPEDEPDAPPANDIRNLNLDRDRVWVNTNSSGIGRLDASGWRIWRNTASPCTGPGCDTTFYQPLFNWALLVDPQGKKWFGCWEFCVDELDDSVDPPKFTHHIIDDVLGKEAHTRMWASAADDSGRRWFGGDTPNLGVVEPIGLEYYSDSLATVGGQTVRIPVYRGNLRTTNSALRGNKVHAITVDKTQRVWVGMSGQGIQRFSSPLAGGPLNPASVSMELILGSNSLDVQGLVARGDTIWALTTHELQRYARSGNNGPIASYTIPEATPLFAANPLAVGPDGSPWVGTEAGIRVFRPNGTSEDFNVRNSPVAGDQIYAIRVDPKSGVVWIGTSTGMNRYDPGYTPPPPPALARLEMRVYPNPISLNRTGIQLRLNGNATLYRGRIFDITGREVATFDVPANGRVIWDGRDRDGRLVKPGVYLVHAEAGGRAATVRIAVIR